LSLKYRNHKKIELFLFLIFIIAFLGNFALNPFSFDNHYLEDIKFKENDKNFELDDRLNTAYYSPKGKPLTIIQHATISNTFFPFSLPTNVSFTLLEGWNSKNVTIDYDGVSHQKDWIINGSFDDGEDPWEYKSSTPTKIVKGDWQPEYVSIEVNPFQILSKGNSGYFEENFTIPETSTSNTVASLSMNYKYKIQNPASPSSTISAFISIKIGSVEKNTSISFTNLVPNAATWNKISLTYDMSEIGQFIPENATLRVGVFVDDTTLTPNRVQSLYIDDIQFKIWTKPNEPNLIIANDVEFDQDYYYENNTFGRGKTFINVERSRTETSSVKFTISKNPAHTEDLSVFNITITSDALKNFNSTVNGIESSTYTANNQISWQIECSFMIPYGYSNNWAEIMKPSDWNVTSILDPYNSEQRDSCTGYDLGSGTLVIPQEVLSPGLWTFKAVSQNYISEGSLNVYNGTVYEKKSRITFGDTFQVNVSLDNSVPYQNTFINCSIEYPNGSLFYQSSEELTSHDIEFGSFVVGKNMPIGSYTAILIWTNNQSYVYRDKVGYLQFYFDVWHHTNLTAVDSYIEKVLGEPLLIKVKFTDYDLNTNIGSALITYNSTLGISGTMIYFGSGIYAIDVDTTGFEIGDYYFSFDASKTYYENQTIMDLIQLNLVAQPLKLVFPTRVVNSTGNNYAICKVNLEGEISGDPVPLANISTDWVNYYSVFDHDNGTYSLNFSTYGLPTEGVIKAYEIEIFANKTNYGSVSDFITLIVRPIQTLAHANNTNIVSYINENFYVKVNYTVEQNGALIIGAQCAVTWMSNYEVSQVADGFIIKYYTSGLNTDGYNSLIRLSKPGYEDALVSITAVINKQEVSISVQVNGDEIAQNNLVELYFKESVNITARIFADREGRFLSGGILTMLSDYYENNLTESQPTYFGSIIVINGDTFSSGLNTIYIRFEKQNYTTTSFSFQFYIRAQPINLNVSINNQNIPENFLIVASFNDLISISCRAFAETEGIYLSGGTVKFVLDFHEIDLTESFNYWYNESLGISTNFFSLGINYVYVKFELSNYTTTAFSFQILVNQIDIRVQTIGFIDSINVYSGDSLTIRVNLTEFGSNNPIENATIYCYWQYGTYFFSEVNEGLYKLDLDLSRNIIGTHRFNLVITTEESIYKSTQYSFLIIITQPELPNYISWIVLISLISAIAILGSLSFRSYVILPRIRRRELLIANKTQPYKDIRNIQAILISTKYGGISFYNKTFSILDENFLTGFSGFIQAIMILGSEYTKDGIKVVNIESSADDIDEKEKEIKELDFNFFHSLICDYKDLRVVLLLTEHSSIRLREIIYLLTKQIYLQNKDLISSFKGNLHPIRSSMEEIINRFLPLYYKNPFELNKSEHYHSVKVSGTLTNLEIRILNVLESKSKYKKDFLLEVIISLIDDVNEDENIIAVESLIQQKMIRPME